jgi:transglutaminase-like putative cysteine protease
MKRREFLIYLPAAASAFAVLEGSRNLHAAELPGGDWRTFELVTSATITKPAGRTALWLPFPMGQSTDYQRTLSVSWEAPGAARADRVKLPGYDVELLHVEWTDAQSIGPVTLTNKVATRDRHVDPSVPPSVAPKPESAETLRKYLRPTALLPTDGVVSDTSKKIAGGHRTDIEKARALYEWVVENTNRDPKTPGCGVGDVASMLKSGYLGGKCADINALFVALARSAGIPARDAYGVRVADSRLGFKSLGRSGDITKAQHCRAEFYSRSHGWIPVDPADVRKVVLEEPPGGLALDDAKVVKARSMLFGAWEMNWVAYNHGHDISLPGSAKASIPFLMYPNGETQEGRLDSLDAAGFKYEIHSREVT